MIEIRGKIEFDKHIEKPSARKGHLLPMSAQVSSNGARNKFFKRRVEVKESSVQNPAQSNATKGKGTRTTFPKSQWPEMIVA